jgi:hypothetical protein
LILSRAKDPKNFNKIPGLKKTDNLGIITDTIGFGLADSIALWTANLSP